MKTVPVLAILTAYMYMYSTANKMVWSMVVMGLSILLLSDCAMAGASGRLCGSDLADALSLVCAERGFHRSSKRSETETPDKECGDYELLPLSNSQSKDGDSHVRVRRSIVQRCCYNRCSFADLESYCARGGATSRGRLDRIFNSRTHGLSSSREASPVNVQPPNNPASRQRFGSSLFKNKPYFFVTPAKRDGLINAGE